MDSAMIVSKSAESIKFIEDVLKQNQVLTVVSAQTAAQARRALIENEYDLCLINAPLPDEFGEALAVDIAQKGDSQVLLLVKAELYDAVTEKVEDYGIITLSKPVSKAYLWSALKFANAAQKRVKKVINENDKLIQKLEDIKIVNRAKLMLISYLNMSEEEAHKYIEKKAMDMRTTRRTVAENILKTYKN